MTEKTLQDWLRNAEYHLTEGITPELEIHISTLRLELRALGIFGTRPDTRSEVYERAFALGHILSQGFVVVSRAHSYLEAEFLPIRVLPDIDRMEQAGLLERAEREATRGYLLSPTEKLQTLIEVCKPSAFEVLNA